MPAWLESVSPGHLAVFLSREASPRKSGLFIRHLFRCFPAVFASPVCFAALDAADLHEMGDLDEQAVLSMARVAGEVAHNARLSAGQDPELGHTATAAALASEVVSRDFYPGILSLLRMAVLERAGGGRGPRKNPVARAMRPVFFEHFGDPRSPVERDPSWLTSTVVKLAEGMYESRDFAAMPILADALMDAGCDHADILDHCRGDGPHVRGCWVVDLLLGKS